jgi:hypothetical protein
VSYSKMRQQLFFALSVLRDQVVHRTLRASGKIKRSEFLFASLVENGTAEWTPQGRLVLTEKGATVLANLEEARVAAAWLAADKGTTLDAAYSMLDRMPEEKLAVVLRRARGQAEPGPPRQDNAFLAEARRIISDR